MAEAVPPGLRFIRRAGTDWPPPRLASSMPDNQNPGGWGNHSAKYSLTLIVTDPGSPVQRLP